MIEKLTKIKSSFNKGIVYALSEMEKFKCVQLTPNGYLVSHEEIDELGTGPLFFAAMQFNYSKDDEEYYSVVFHGKGYSQILRECRHTYWGEDGYIFYPDGAIITAAFKELANYFDEMQ